MVVAVTSGEVLAILRSAFGFLEDDYDFGLDLESADRIGSLVAFASRRTFVVVAWDLRSNDLSAEFNPIDESTGRPVLTTRVLLSELLAINGASRSECVRAPEAVTADSARATAQGLARSVQKHATLLLAGEWGGTLERITEWTNSGAWRAWRDG